VKTRREVAEFTKKGETREVERGGLRVGGRGTTTETGNDEDHEAQHTSPPEGDMTTEIQNIKASEIDLRIELAVTDRREKVLRKAFEKQCRYRRKLSPSKRTSILLLL
jgi:hypothetical protein